MPPGSRLVHSEALKDERMGWWMGWSLLAIGLLRAPSGLKEGSTRKKVAVLLDFVQITSPPPPPPYLDNLYNFSEHQKRRFK